MAVVMGGDIAAVVAIITAGAVAAATTMAGGIIAIGGDLSSPAIAEVASVGDFFHCPPPMHVNSACYWPSTHEPAELLLARLSLGANGTGDKVGSNTTSLGAASAG
jgi:hypothetical protein